MKDKDPWMNRIVLRQGMFHTAMCYQACIGHLYGSAGLRDLLIEAGILTEGSVDKVLKGEHWERGFYALNIAAEGFKRLLFMAFIVQLESEDKHTMVLLQLDVDKLRCSLSHHELEKLKDSLNFARIELQFQAYTASLQSNARFWFQFIDILVDLGNRHLRSVRSGDWKSCLETEIEMLPWFHGANRSSYKRHKTLYLL
jgi:hypothetical protein